jgi:hypothetical protein
MPPGRFDSFVFADYSGAASESAQRRTIALWIQEGATRPRRVPGPFTRESLREALLEILVNATRRRRRVLFGIDHQWSWPRDLWRAAGLSRLPWRRALACLVAGSARRPPLGVPGVFPSAFNAFTGDRIFHCRVKGLARRYGLPSASGWGGEARRLTERLVPGAKPATRLGGSGAVAGQTLHGLIQLHRLLRDAAAARVAILAWPFDALADRGTSHVGVEVYPSLYRPRSVPKSDDADARACCVWAARADLARVLDLGAAPPGVRRAARLEGWILGTPLNSDVSFRATTARGGSRE